MDVSKSSHNFVKYFTEVCAYIIQNVSHSVPTREIHKFIQDCGVFHFPVATW